MFRTAMLVAMMFTTAWISCGIVCLFTMLLMGTTCSILHHQHNVTVAKLEGAESPGPRKATSNVLL